MAGIVVVNPDSTVVVSIAPGLTPDAQVLIPASSPMGHMLASLFFAGFVGRRAADAVNNVPELISVPQWAIARLFLARCNFSDNFLPARLSPLNVSFTAAFWSRILSHFVELGLLQDAHTSPRALIDAVLTLPVDDDVLAIRAADVCPSAPFDTPAVRGADVAPVPAVPASAARGSGRNRVPATIAQAAVPGAPGAIISHPVLGPPNLRFLALATLLSFVDASNPVAPLTGLAFLIGHLGDTLTTGCRIDDAGILQSAAEIIRHGIKLKFGDVLGEGALARQLPGFINAVAANFTTLFESDSFAPADLEVELSSAVTLFVGSSDARASVERQRAIFAIPRVRN
jgi:hypothetical protein